LYAGCHQSAVRRPDPFGRPPPQRTSAPPVHGRIRVQLFHEMGSTPGQSGIGRGNREEPSLQKCHRGIALKYQVTDRLISQGGIAASQVLPACL
jgi:hypothetical protein